MVDIGSVLGVGIKVRPLFNRLYSPSDNFKLDILTIIFFESVELAEIACEFSSLNVFLLVLEYYQLCLCRSVF